MNKKELIATAVQFIKFGLVGVSNTLLGLGLYYLFLWLKASYMLANLLSWFLSVLNAYFWNNKYVFAAGGSWVWKLLRTYVSYGVSFLAGAVLLYLLVEYFGCSQIVAPILCLLLTIPMNFLMNKFWTFRQEA